jgi:hypothetical protein
MIRSLLEQRRVLTLSVSAVLGTLFLQRWPFHADAPLLILLHIKVPWLFLGLRAGYGVMAFGTPCLLVTMLLSVVYIFLLNVTGRLAPRRLPPYPAPAARDHLYLVLGETHHPTRAVPAPCPQWLTLPARGLFTGIAIVGAVGSGKTSGCMYPYADQLLGYRPQDPARRLSALVLEVKGDFCYQLREIAARHGRAADYVEVSLDSGYRYNPLHNDLEAYALAYGIASLLNNLFGRSEEPFWQQAYTNLVKFIILLHKVVDGYVTLFDVYASAIDPERIAAKLADGERELSRTGLAVLVEEADLAKVPTLTERFTWSRDPDGRGMLAELTTPLGDELRTLGITHTTQPLAVPVQPVDPVRRDQFAAVRRWFEHDWTRIEPKLRTSIIEGISVFLSLFDDNPAVKYAFCPPKECYDPVANADGRYGTPLPPFADLIESGRICALNFPVVANPGLAKMIGTLMKQDFQRAVLGRIPQMARAPGRPWREVLFLCDEYHAFATVGENDPTGDEKFFALSRQARCIPIVATQSLSSLRSTLPGESWRTLFQTFRTKIFLSLSDDFSARVASELCGRTEHLKPRYTIAESGQDAGVSMLTGRAAAHRATMSASKSYQLQRDFVFEAKTFAELKNAQAIVLAYDGFNPRPPTLCYLKPYYLDPNETYFAQRARGVLS